MAMLPIFGKKVNKKTAPDAFCIRGGYAFLECTGDNGTLAGGAFQGQLGVVVLGGVLDD